LARRWLGEFAVALVKGLPVAELLFFALRTLSTAPDYHISPWPSTMWPNQRFERTGCQRRSACCHPAAQARRLDGRRRIMSVTLTYLRLYAEVGVSHFAPLEIEVSPRDFAPPAPPFSVSALAPAFRYGFLHLASGWVGDPHPSPFACGSSCYLVKWNSRLVMASGTKSALEARCCSKTPQGSAIEVA
jgi:hypothetical protein